MNALRRAICCALLCSPTTFALAAATWAQEPAGLFGILLGRPFPAAGVIADCPLFEPFRRENLPTSCASTRAQDSAPTRSC